MNHKSRRRDGALPIVDELREREQAEGVAGAGYWLGLYPDDPSSPARNWLIGFGTAMDEDEVSTKEFLVGLAVVLVCGGLSGAGMALDWGYVTAFVWPIGIIGLAYWHRRQRKKAE